MPAASRRFDNFKSPSLPIALRLVVPVRALVETRARLVRIAISRLPIIPWPLRLMKGLQLTRRHDCIPISTWLHNQIVSRIVIAMP